MKRKKKDDSENCYLPPALARIGIPSIDKILAPLLADGGTIVIGSRRYEDGLILGCQIAGRVIKRSHDVRYIGHGEDRRSLAPRIISSMELCPVEKVQSRWTLKWSCPDEMSSQEAENILSPHRLAARHLKFGVRRADCGRIVLGDEYLWIINCWNFSSHEERTLAENIVEEEAGFGVPVIVLYELPGAQNLGACPALGASQFRPRIQKYVDCSIEISNPTMDLGEKGFEDVPRQDQFIAVRGWKGRKKLVPVLCEPAFQRYLPREETKGPGELESGV